MRQEALYLLVKVLKCTKEGCRRERWALGFVADKPCMAA